MTKPVRRAGVIGAGVMGSGIMAHFANAGVDVVMLDIVPPGLSEEDKKKPANRNRFSAGGLQGALKAKPAAFFHKNYAKRVTIGNLEDNIDLLKGCDLVIEAIIENAPRSCRMSSAAMVSRRIRDSAKATSSAMADDRWWQTINMSRCSSTVLTV